MRLARPLYESVPAVYAGIGAIAIRIAYLDPDGEQAALCCTIGLIAEIAAFTVFLRRQDCRELDRDYSGAHIESPAPMPVE